MSARAPQPGPPASAPAPANQDAAPAPGASLRFVPADQAPFADLQTVYGTTGDAAGCQCQWYRIPGPAWRETPVEELTSRNEAQTHCGPDETTSGFLAYDGDEPVGWCALAPRTEYARLRTMRIPWTGRPDESRDDDGVWAVTCFTVRRGYRRRGIANALARAAVDFARERGARAVEGYPVVAETGERRSSAELFVGSVSQFAAAGFREVSRPTDRRAVMRLDF